MRKKEQGFTLVELVIGMAILSLIMSGTYGILASSVKSYQYNFAQGKNIQDSRQLFNEMTKGIKNATTITSPDAKTLNYSITTDTGTDHYIISLDTDTINLKKNTLLIRSWAKGQVKDLKFTLTKIPNGLKNKVQIVINLTFKTSNDPQSTTVTTLNDIP